MLTGAAGLHLGRRRPAGALLLAGAAALAAISLHAVHDEPVDRGGRAAGTGSAADLRIALRDPGGAVHLQGSSFTVSATVSSPAAAGASAVAQPVVLLELPAALAFRSVSGAGWSCSGTRAPGGDSVRCAGETLPAGAAASLALVVDARGGGPLVSLHATVSDATGPTAGSGSTAALLVLLAAAAARETTTPAVPAAATGLTLPVAVDPMPPLDGLLLALALALGGAVLVAPRRPILRAARRPPAAPR